MAINNKHELTGRTAETSCQGSDLLVGLKNGAPALFNINMIRGASWCGRRWRRDLTTPVAESYIGDLDLLRNLPGTLGLGCYLVDDAHNRRKLDPNNHYKLATGESVTLDGARGQYQWGWATGFYFAEWVEGNYDNWAVGLSPIPGRRNYYIPVASKSAIGHGVMDRTENKLCSLISTDARYRGGNGSAIASGNACDEILSQLGYPATSISTAQFEAYGRARGSGWGAGWYWIETVVYALFCIIFGTRDSQASANANKDTNGLYQGGLGSGVTSLGSWDTFNGLYPVIPTSAGISLGDGCGPVTYNVLNSSNAVHYAAPVPVFFGLKNPFGHLWLGKNRIVGVKQSDASYKFYVAKSSLTEWNYSNTGDMLYIGQTEPGTSAWKCISRLTMDGLAGMPMELDGTTSTGHCDGAYLDNSVSGFRSPLGAGFADHGGDAGLAYFLGYYAPSNAAAHLSSPLCECAEDFNPVPVLYV